MQVPVSRFVRLAVAAVGIVAAPAIAIGRTRPVEEQAKIEFLIGEVRSSPAIFIRNGREYPASRAASHLARKLKFAGRRVQTARQFIVGIASSSSESGMPYEIRWPDGRRRPLGQWLLERLELYEKEPVPKSAAVPPR